MLLIRRSDGSAQYLRPVAASRSETAMPPSNSYESNGQQMRRMVAPGGERTGTYVRTITVPTRIVKIGVC